LPHLHRTFMLFSGSPVNKYLLCLIISGSVAFCSQTAEQENSPEVEIIYSKLANGEGSIDYYTGKIDGKFYQVIRTQTGGEDGFNYKGKLPQNATVSLEQAYWLFDAATHKEKK
jgi:hypothetical protein